MNIDAKLIEDAIKKIRSLNPTDASIISIASTLQQNVSETDQKTVLNVLNRIIRVLENKEAD